MRLFYPLSFFETFSYPKNMASLDPDLRSPSNDTLNNLFGAFGSVLGYIGVDAATARSFEHLLWPQDFLYGFSINAAPKLALLHPMRGPLHKAALKTEDTIFNHGLLKGSDKGHMLGTFFFFFFQSWDGCIPCTAMANNLPTQSLFATVCGLVYLCASTSRPWHKNTTARALRKDSQQKYPDIDVYPDIKCKISAPTSNHPALRHSTEPQRTWMKKKKNFLVTPIQICHSFT